ncbi:hypothetical protein Tco_0614670 [Tanacetum coccineum]
MITEEMKQTEHYQMYTEVFGIDVPLNPGSTPFTPPAPVPNVDKADEMILQDTLQVSLAEHKSREEQEAKENVTLVDEHLTSEKIDKMVEGQENVERGNIQAQILTQIENAIANVIPFQVDASVRSYMSRHILHVYPAQSHTSSIPDQQYQLYLAMKAYPQLQQQDIAIWLALQIKFERNMVLKTACRTPVVCPRDKDDPHDDAHPEGENSAKRQKTSEYEAYVSRLSHPYGQESSKVILISPHPRKTTPLVHSCQKDPEAPALSLINQDLLYLKKGNSGPEKIVLSLHKFPAIIFNDDDIEERTSRWVNKYRDYADTGLIWSLSVFIRSTVIWERVHDFQLGIESYQQKVNLTAPTMTFPGIEDHEMLCIIYEPVHGIIYKNSKKEKRVIRHLEIYKFCDATLNRVLEGLKSYNNDVKYGYVQKDLTKDETKYLKLFEEEIEASKADEKRGDVREWKTTWIKKRKP